MASKGKAPPPLRSRPPPDPPPFTIPPIPFESLILTEPPEPPNPPDATFTFVLQVLDLESPASTMVLGTTSGVAPGVSTSRELSSTARSPRQPHNKLLHQNEDLDFNRAFPIVPPVPPESEAFMPWDLCYDVDVISTQPLLLLLPLAEVSLIRTLTITGRYSVFRYSLVSKLINFVSADCKCISLHCSSFQSLEDWALKDEILTVNCFLKAAFITLAQAFGGYLFTVMCRSQPKHFFTGKPWSHVDGPSFLSFKLSQDVMMFWNDSFPRFEDVTHPWSFRVKFVLPLYEEVTLCSTTLLPHCEAATWNCVFVAMDSIVSDWSTWLWWSCSQLLGSSASPSATSIGLSSLPCLSDSIVPCFALRLGMDLNEITGFFIFENLVTLFTPLSCCSNLCTAICLAVAFAKGLVPKLCCLNTLV
ncbi:hypothetical protein YC2023_022087 [Brassica napus]